MVMLLGWNRRGLFCIAFCVVWTQLSSTCRSVELVPQLGHSASIDALAISSSGSQIATAGNDYSVRLWDSESGSLIRSFPHNGPVGSIAFSPDGETLASGAQDGKLIVWNSRTGRAGREYIAASGTIKFVNYSADGSRIYAGSEGRDIC